MDASPTIKFNAIDRNVNSRTASLEIDEVRRNKADLSYSRNLQVLSEIVFICYCTRLWAHNKN